MRQSYLGLISILVLIALLGAKCNRHQIPEKVISFAAKFKLDQKWAHQDLSVIAAQPHPFGSKEQRKIADYLETEIARHGFHGIRSAFTATTPNRLVLEATEGAPINPTVDKAGFNIFAFAGVAPKEKCVVAVASHYDTKILKGADYRGANDSGSSSVVLLQILAAIRDFAQKEKLACDVMAVWFDGEESQLDEWNDGLTIHPARLVDNTYGSRYEASRLVACNKALCLPGDLGGGQLKALILLDMIGSPGISITKDTHSTKELRTLLDEADKKISRPAIVTGRAIPVEDDHIPFIKRGVPAINLIDFENITTWHQPGDVIDTVSMESMEKAAKLALALIITLSL